MITGNSRIKLLKTTNPYIIGSGNWNAFVDIYESLGANRITSINRLIRLYNTDISYYRCYIGELIADGVVSVIG